MVKKVLDYFKAQNTTHLKTNELFLMFIKTEGIEPISFFINEDSLFFLNKDGVLRYAFERDVLELKSGSMIHKL